jgi:hypothetical protein
MERTVESGEIKEKDGDNGRDSNTNDNQKGNSIRIGKDRTESLLPNVSITRNREWEKKERRERGTGNATVPRVIAWLYARNT